MTYDLCSVHWELRQIVRNMTIWCKNSSIGHFLMLVTVWAKFHSNRRHSCPTDLPCGVEMLFHELHSWNFDNYLTAENPFIMADMWKVFWIARISPDLQTDTPIASIAAPHAITILIIIAIINLAYLRNKIILRHRSMLITHSITHPHLPLPSPPTGDVDWHSPVVKLFDDHRSIFTDRPLNKNSFKNKVRTRGPQPSRDTERKLHNLLLSKFLTAAQW